jgi:hypothetical protein
LTAVREVPPAHVPGETLTVSVTTAPPGNTLAHAIEETPPAGWAVSAISDGGEFDATSGQVKWGPFLDPVPRVLTYQVTPPAVASGDVAFTGTASLDGRSIVVAGDAVLPESCRLSVVRNDTTGALAVCVYGQAGVHFGVWVSHDLQSWSPISLMLTNGQRLEYSAETLALFPQTFYRIQPVP